MSVGAQLAAAADTAAAVALADDYRGGNVPPRQANHRIVGIAIQIIIIIIIIEIIYHRHPNILKSVFIVHVSVMMTKVGFIYFSHTCKRRRRYYCYFSAGLCNG